jgi:DMSO reductase anchor subunit
MTIEWEIVLAAAFAAVGILEYLKGFFKSAPGAAWRIVQPVLCLAFAAVAALLPSWVMVGILALALSQIGYDTIIQVVKKKLGGEK